MKKFRKQRGWTDSDTIGLLVIILLLVIVVGVYYYYNLRDRQSQEIQTYKKQINILRNSKSTPEATKPSENSPTPTVKETTTTPEPTTSQTSPEKEKRQQFIAECLSNPVVGNNIAYIHMFYENKASNEDDVLQTAKEIMNQFQNKYQVQIISWSFDKRPPTTKTYEWVYGLQITFFKSPQTKDPTQNSTQGGGQK